MHRSLLALDHRFDAAFGAAANPLKQLGALAFWLLALLAVSGIVLYALLDTSVQGAYASVERLHAAPWRSGDLLRGLHRYAADAFALVLLLHLLREAALAHFAAFRRYAWITGVVLLPIMIFHQMQLMVCAVLARRYAATQPPATNPVPVAAE